jgi:glycosyltransferase involved in cell wall biosynthesis
VGGRRHILQIFNRYLQYGGEEAAVFQTGDALQEMHDVEYFMFSTGDLMEGKWTPWSLASKALYNGDIDQRLRQFQATGKFDAWLIHNIFPAMSPIVYQRALEWDIPIIQYLHNYRFSCVNGFFLNHGEPCQRCLSGNFWAAFSTACWHDSHVKSGWMGVVTSRVRKMALFEKVFQWIALSEAHKREHVRMGIPADRIAVVNHFYEPKTKPLPTVQEPTALFVGRLSPEKGVSQLLDAWKLVAGGSRRLLIVGDGPERGKLEQQAAGLRGVTFLGFLKGEEQSAAWAQALFSLVPSIWIEPFGMTVLEAWARGRPVVGHRIGALPELIEHGVTGMLADLDPADLARQMEQLFSAPQEAAQMGRTGFARLAADFSKKRWKERMAEIYGKLP